MPDVLTHLNLLLGGQPTKAAVLLFGRNPQRFLPSAEVRCIEKFGTGTLMMIRESLAHALPEPDFVQQAGELVTTVWRDWLTEKVLRKLQLNERQARAVEFLRQARRISNRDYRKLTGANDRTALRDLSELVAKKLLVRSGKTGRSAFYQRAMKPAINPTNPTTPSQAENPTQTRQTPPERDIKGTKGTPAGQPEGAINVPTAPKPPSVRKRVRKG